MTSPAQIQPYLEAARRYVSRALGLELDGSDTSLAFVDHYITQTARAEALKPDVLALIAPALGIYFAEVVLAKLGGRWLIEGDDPNHWRVELTAAPVTFHPVGMAAEALRSGEVDGYDGAFTTREDLMGPLAQALESSPPVDEGYYYSLTGRLETLEHTIDLLVEIERSRRQTPPDERN